MSTLPTVTPDWIAERVRKQLHGAFRCFQLHFIGAKRPGRRGVQHLDAYGVVFPSGHVVVDTDELARKGYESMTDLLESLNTYGTVEIEELGEMKQ